MYCFNNSWLWLSKQQVRARDADSNQLLCLLSAMAQARYTL
jgi:hypothetical protein